MTNGGYRFLYGADMAPEAIRRAFPRAVGDARRVRRCRGGNHE